MNKNLMNRRFWVKNYNLWLVVTIIAINGIFLKQRHLSNVDEFSSLAAAAFLGGDNWTPLCETAAFHGFGMTIILTPLYYFGFDGQIIYKFLLVICLLMRIGNGALVKALAQNVFSISESQAFMTAVLCEAGMLAPDEGAPLSAMSEVPSLFICLIALWLFVKGRNSNRIIFYLFSSICLAYGSFVHSRILIAYAGMLICATYYLIRSNKRRIVLAFLFAFAVSYYCLTQISKNIIALVYGGRSSTELITTTSGLITSRIGKYFGYLLDLERIKTLLFTIMSQFGAYTFFTFGFIWFFLLLGVKECIAYARIKKHVRSDETKIVIIIWGLFSFIGMIFSISLSSTGAVLEGNYRWLTYLRYSLPYSTIVCMIGWGVLFERKAESKDFVAAGMIGAVAMKFFVIYTCNVLDTSGYKINYSIFNRLFCVGKPLSKVYFSQYLLAVISVWIVVLIARKNRSVVVLIFLITSALINLHFYKYFQSVEYIKEKTSQVTIDFINSDFCLSDEVYMIGNQKYLYEIQAASPRKTVYPVEEICSDYCMIFSDNLVEVSDMYVYQLGEKQYVYCSNLDDYNQIIDWLQKYD